jgi:hypothetical protein
MASCSRKAIRDTSSRVGTISRRRFSRYRAMPFLITASMVEEG